MIFTAASTWFCCAHSCRRSCSLSHRLVPGSNINELQVYLEFSQLRPISHFVLDMLFGIRWSSFGLHPYTPPCGTGQATASSSGKMATLLHSLSVAPPPKKKIQCSNLMCSLLGKSWKSFAKCSQPLTALLFR